MFVRQRLTLGLSMILGLIGWMAVPMPAQSGAQPAQAGSSIVDSIRFREIGPTRQGGRYVEFAVVESNPRVFYAATATGGLWKTVNNGITFTSVFDDQPDFALGAVAVAQSRPDVVYLGTGESNNSRSTYDGNGVYKSVDGGQKWTKAGLPNAGRIGRIVVHPKNPDIVYVAASGRLYSENPDRGVYRSTDGGANWTKTLDHKVDGRAIGAIDIVMDPVNANTLYAATYDKVRKPWTFGEGGPGSAIFKSTDGGVKWTQLTTGLPTGMLGRIGLSIARNAPKTVYAVIENANSRTVPPEERAKRLAQGFGDGSIGDELHRSDDAGATWRKVSPVEAEAAPAAAAPAPAGRGAAPAAPQAAQGRGGRGGGFQGGGPPYWYGQIRVDPNDKEHVYLLSVGVTHTTDGGKTWTSPFGFGGDNHALWINPTDSSHLILGHDHGMGVSFDAGRTWLSPDNKPLAQFYAVRTTWRHPTTSTAVCRTTDRCAARARSPAAPRFPSNPGIASAVATAFTTSSIRPIRAGFTTKVSLVRSSVWTSGPASRARSATAVRRGRMRCVGTGPHRSCSRRTIPKWSTTPRTCYCVRRTAAIRGPRSAPT